MDSDVSSVAKNSTTVSNNSNFRKLPSINSETIAERRDNPDPVSAKQEERAAAKVEARKVDNLEERRTETYSQDKRITA